jgi:crotonobetainyl-CoA:carnitine CoA-transferase CaiB-like acyl-CoA transferase
MNEPLLSGVRVVELSNGKLEMAGRFLADLGADVVLLEPPGGAPSRRRWPMHGETSLYFAARNSNKRGVTCDLGTPAGRDKLWALLGEADMLIETGGPGGLERLGIERHELAARFPNMIVISISDFGLTGPYADWQATDWVQLALGTQLSRSGLPGRIPLMPPSGMSYETAAIVAAYSGLLAYLQRLETGRGDEIDFSVHEATLTIMDPPIGTIGTAAIGAGGNSRPTSLYPIFTCVDGHVRALTLAQRQWRNMRAWLGEPDQFQDAALDTLQGRAAARDDLSAYYREFFRNQAKDDATTAGQARGVPIAPVLSLGDVLAEQHFGARGAFADDEIAPGLRARIPSGFVEIDGQRAGFRRRAPQVGEHDADPWTTEHVATASPRRQPISRRPLDGVRVLDFGVIVVGAEVGRLLADAGAEVIKIESRAFPDGMRTAAGPVTGAVAPIFAIGHRNEKSFGVNLRTPKGIQVFLQLVAASDVVVSNFKPGTLEKLGLGCDVLRAIKPQLVWMSSSAMGHTGPWRDWAGYGPLVRCAAGITSLWRYPNDPDGFCEQTTIYPDHYAARVAAATIVAAIVRRRRTGEGADIRLSQAECVINQLAEEYLRESLEPGSMDAAGNRSDEGAPWGVYPCAGEEEYCVITVRDDAEWQHFREAIGNPSWANDPRLATVAGRVAARDQLDARVQEWTSTMPARRVTETLQAARVPAGDMRSIADITGDPHLRARGFVVWQDQPGYRQPMPVESRPFHSHNMPAPRLNPAPVQGEHTRELASSLLRMADRQIEDLVSEGVLEVPEPTAECDKAQNT